MGKSYLKGSQKYEISTGPGVSTSYCEYSTDAETDSIDVKELQKAIEESFEDMGEKGLAEYASRRDYMDKVISIHPPIPCDRNGRVLSGEVYDPYLFWTVYTSDVLDKKEEKSLLDYITGQCSDGWGEGFEQRPVTKYSGEWEEEYEDEDPDTGEMDWGTETYSVTYKVFYSPWQHRNWNIKITGSGEVREKATSRKNNYITIKEEVRINQGNQEVILEKGDRVRILSMMENASQYMPQTKNRQLDTISVGAISKEILKLGLDINVLSKGNALTHQGKLAMKKNGRKWTIGVKTEIIINNKKVEFSFDAITDEGGGTTYYAVNSFDNRPLFSPVLGQKALLTWLKDEINAL